MNTKTVTVKGTLYWAFLGRPNNYDPAKPTYQVDVGQLSDAAVKALESIGVVAKHKEEQGFYITCKSKFPIRAYDKEGNEIDTDEIVVGNGSKATVIVDTYNWIYKGKKGISPMVAKGGLKITELVEYVADRAAEVDEAEAL